MNTVLRPQRAAARSGHGLAILIAVPFLFSCLLCQSTPAFFHSELQEMLRTKPQWGCVEECVELKQHYFEIWRTLPKPTQNKLFRRHWKRIARTFCGRVATHPSFVRLTGPRSAQFHELVDACEHALGRHIDVQSIGSRARGTATLSDLDLQVRRTGSRQADTPFTDLDKRKVASNIQKLPYVKDLEIGNVAIKFRIFDTRIDLVLWKWRPEPFPQLRRGNNFEENAARINAFLEESPVARDAIVAIKRFLEGKRPKGILLEAIAWRLAVEGEIPLTSSAGEVSYFNHVLDACLRLTEELVHWQRSPIFGSELSNDLQNLPEVKKQEYLLGLQQVRDMGMAGVRYAMLSDALFSKANKQAKQRPFQSLYSVAEQTFRESFDKSALCFLSLQLWCSYLSALRCQPSHRSLQIEGSLATGVGAAGNRSSTPATHVLFLRCDFKLECN